MKNLLVVVLMFVIMGCNNKKHLYNELDRRYYIKYDISDNREELDTLYTFYKFDDPSKVSKIGFIKDGFMNSTWTYNQEKEIKEIVWAHYHDENLKFETNLFDSIDTLKQGDYFSKFRFLKNGAPIILSISINGPIRDSLPQINYDRITKNSLQSLGIKIKSYNSMLIKSSNSNLHLVNSAVIIPNGETKHVRAAYGYLDAQTFIEISVNSSAANDFMATELFYAATVNFSINKKFLVDHSGLKFK
jgi:hypothetical protein